MNEKKKKFLVVNDIARELNKSPITIISWVRWSEGEGKNHPKLKLPTAMRIAKNKGRAWKLSDLKAFKKFDTLLSTTERGTMSEYNARIFWGKRGKKILKRKEQKRKELIS